MHLVVDHVRLIDGTGREPTLDGVLQAADGKITYVGPRASAPGVAEATIVDAKGATLIPGLIDTHVHLCSQPVSDFEGYMSALEPEQAKKNVMDNARLAVRGGVTTVRDLGSKGTAVVDSLDELRNMPNASRVVTCGTWLTAKGGHCHYAAREIEGAEDAALAVREQHSSGASWIKVVATGGVLSSGMEADTQSLDDATLSRIVLTARELGMRVAAHAIGAQGIEAALRAGVDSIEHGCYVGEANREAFSDRPTWLVPTFSAPDRICADEGVADWASAKASEVTEHHKTGFPIALQDGIRIAAGSDAGTPSNPVGELWRELALMAENGMSLHNVLLSATNQASQLLGMGEIGTLEVGKLADAVMLQGDPLTDVAAYKNISLVILNGRPIQ